jgi:hypothetical protein
VVVGYCKAECSLAISTTLWLLSLYSEIAVDVIHAQNSERRLVDAEANSQDWILQMWVVLYPDSQ